MKKILFLFLCLCLMNILNLQCQLDTHTQDYLKCQEETKKLVEQKQFQRAKKKWEAFLIEHSNSYFRVAVEVQIEILEEKLQSEISNSNQGQNTSEAEVVQNQVLSANEELFVNFSGNNKRWAILVSVNNYISRPLRGPNRDMELLRSIMQNKYSFDNNNLIYLSNDNASKDNVQYALQRVLNKVQKDDLVVFAFSGHGTQIEDKQKEEPDGLDEAICLKGKDGATTYLRDDILYYYFSRILSKEAYLVNILDCCHSGSGYRKGKNQLPPDYRYTEIENVENDDIIDGDQGIVIGRLADNMRLVSLAACKDNEFAKEKSLALDGSFEIMGVFTRALYQALEKAEENMTWADIQYAIKNRAYFSQTPQIRGNLQMKIFQAQTQSHKRPYCQVKEVKEGKIYLDQGILFGIDKGAKIGIYKKLPDADEEDISNYLGSYVVNTSEATASVIDLQGQDFNIQTGYYGILEVPAKTYKPHCLILDGEFSQSERQELKELQKNIAIDIVEEEQNILDLSKYNRFPLTISRTQNKFIIKGGPTDKEFALSEIKNMVHWIEDSLVWFRLLLVENRFSSLTKREQCTITINDILTVTLNRGKGKDSSNFQIGSALSVEPELKADYRLKLEDDVSISYKNISNKPIFVTIVYFSNNGHFRIWNKHKFKDAVSPGIELTSKITYKITPPTGSDYLKVFITYDQAFDPTPYETSGFKSNTISHWLIDIQMKPTKGKPGHLQRQVIKPWYVLDAELKIEE